MPESFDLEALRARQAAARDRRAEIVDLDAPVTHTAAQAIAACPRCDADGYRGDVVCDHVDHASEDTRAAAMADIRAALGKGGAS